MSAASNYLETMIMDLLTQGDNKTAPSTYVALFTTDPTDAASGTEVSGNGYARTRVYTDGATSPYWNTPSNGQTDNNGNITFPQATGSWGTVTHFAIFDAVSGGNMLIHGALTAQKTISIGDTFEFASGDLDISVA